MKNKIFITIFAFALLSISGCKKYFEDLEDSPNEPQKVNLPSLLSGSQGGIYAAFNANLARTSSIFTQQSAGVDRQYIAFDVYQITESDVDNDWANLYSGALFNLSDLIAKAKSENSPYYSGIGKTLKAMSLGLATDLWGDIPNSEAFQGVNNLSPKYDTQQQVYENIQILLNEAIVDFKTPKADTPTISTPKAEIMAKTPKAEAPIANTPKASIVSPKA